jgi:acetyltransferase-like isoleucine patch superfamily enzyme
MATRIHPTAEIETPVAIGDGTAVWDHVHIRRHARIGQQCIIGEKTYLAPEVVIGDRVKINAFVYICTGVTIEDGVMISAGTIFTNDRFPRATTTDLKQLRPSEPDEHTRPTWVRQGATLGAGCIVGNDLEIGRFAMVGMGSLVTRSVPAFHLVIGHPARSVGCVCRCGEPFVRFGPEGPPEIDDAACMTCGLRYAVRQGKVIELSPEGEFNATSMAQTPPSLLSGERDSAQLRNGQHSPPPPSLLGGARGCEPTSRPLNHALHNNTKACASSVGADQDLRRQ